MPHPMYSTSNSTLTAHLSTPPQSPPTPSQRLHQHHQHLSPYVQPTHHKLTKRAPRRNRPHSPFPVPKLRRNRQRPLIPDAHVQQALIPPLDDLPLADGKVQRLAAVVAGVEFGAVGGESAAVAGLQIGGQLLRVWWGVLSLVLVRKKDETK